MFEGLVGQAALRGMLERQWRRGGANHALLFVGPAGCGKRTFARAYAQALLCVGGGDDVDGGDNGANGGVDGGDNGADASNVPCGTCKPCALFAQGLLDDYMELAPAPGAKSIPVDAVRALADWAATRPVQSPRKVAALCDADKMTEQAQNALLKTLEEPPDYATLILTAPNPEALIPTIRSRCATMRFERYADGEVAQVLQAHEARAASKRPAYGRAAADTAALVALADGVPGRALALAADPQYEALRGEAANGFFAFLRGGADAFVEFPLWVEKNRERFDLVADVLRGLLRDMWAYRATGDGAAIRNGDLAAELIPLAERLGERGILARLDALEAWRGDVSGNQNFSLALNAALVRLGG